MHFLDHILEAVGGGSSGVVVQTDEVIFSSGTSQKQDTISAVTLNKSFMFFTYKSADGGNDPRSNFVRGRILNTTTLEFNTNANANANITIRWYVIEFPATSNVTVQHSGDVSMASSTLNQTISTVDLSHTFPIMSYSTSDTSWDDSQPVMAQLTSTTNLQLTAQTAFTTKVNWQVIENLDWDVSEYTDSMGSGDTTEATPISAVDLTETFFLVTGKYTGGAVTNGNEFPRHYLNSTTELMASRQTSGVGYSMTYYVIETNGTVAVQHANSEQIASSANSNTTTVSAIDTTKSAILQGNMNVSVANNLTSSSNDGDDVYILHEITNSTTLRQERAGSNSLVAEYALSVLDFS